MLLSPALLLAALAFAPADEPEVIPLWNGGAPGFENRREEPEVAKDYYITHINNPTLTAYLPPKDKATGAAVVICPGGGHRLLVYKAEGVEPAEYLNSIGVAAFVLKYRLPREEGSPYKLDEHPIQDGQRAMRLVRSRAKEWGIDPARIGIMGFSAGGEVASMVAFAPESSANDGDLIDKQNARPDFLVEIYPGPLGIPETVPADAPPAFLLVANDDRGAAPNIVALTQKYREAHRPVEAHILAAGGHGFNLGQRSGRASVKTWPQRLADWMGDNGFLDPEHKPEK